jgi:hypothetical protein
MLGSTTENPALRDPFSVNDQEKRAMRALDHYNDFALEAIYEAGPASTSNTSAATFITITS